MQCVRFVGHRLLKDQAGSSVGGGGRAQSASADFLLSFTRKARNIKTKRPSRHMVLAPYRVRTPRVHSALSTKKVKQY